MSGSKLVQIVPAGSRQVAPGVFQAPRRHHSGGGGKHHRKHHSRGGFRQSSMFGGSAAKALVLLQQIGNRLPQGISPGMFLFQYGMAKHQLGVANIGKFLWLQSLAASNPSMLQFLSIDPMMGMFGLGGAAGPVGGRGPMFTPQSTPQAPSASDMQDATAMLQQLNSMGVV